MKIAGYAIKNMNKTIIVSSGAENGYPNNLMITVVDNGIVGYQKVFLDESTLLSEIKKTNDIKSGYHWVSRLSLSRLNKTSKAPVFGRNVHKTLIPLV